MIYTGMGWTPALLIVAVVHCSSTLLGQTRQPTGEALLKECELSQNPDCATEGSRVGTCMPSLDGVSQDVPSQAPATQPSTPQWQYGGFVDFGYSYDFNHPENRIFRSRGTVWHVNELDWNMAGAYVKKNASEQSRLGAVFTIQAGKDSEIFGFSATAPNLA